MYRYTGYLPCIQRGHLVPAKTYSFSFASIHSTFVYTNAVPQYGKFNSGMWSKYEEKVRDYAQETCRTNIGDLYLLTGISRIRMEFAGFPPQKVSVFRALRYMPEEPNIAIPNSMWTAGCCVSTGTSNKVYGAFAVIGNNDFMKENIHMTKMTVKELAKKLGKGINLFPGNNGCNENIHYVDIWPEL